MSYNVQHNKGEIILKMASFITIPFNALNSEYQLPYQLKPDLKINAYNQAKCNVI